MNIPEKIRSKIKGKIFDIDTVGMSDSQVLSFADVVLKIEKESEEADNEAVIMDWIKDRLSVPKILEFVKENNTNFLLMTKIHGEMSCSEDMMRDPQLLVKLLAEGLKMLWNVDITDCPYDSSIDSKLRLAKIRVDNGLVDLENVEPETFGEDGFHNPEELLKWLQENKPKEDLVFSHGDYCLPNIFVDNNKMSGFIDLGRAGVGDRYQDIALCFRSLCANFSGKYSDVTYEGFTENMLFEALGVEPDWDKIKYYNLLDELF